MWRGAGLETYHGRHDANTPCSSFHRSCHPCPDRHVTTLTTFPKLNAKQAPSKCVEYSRSGRDRFRPPIDHAKVSGTGAGTQRATPPPPSAAHARRQRQHWCVLVPFTLSARSRCSRSRSHPWPHRSSSQQLIVRSECDHGSRSGARSMQLDRRGSRGGRRSSIGADLAGARSRPRAPSSDGRRMLTSP